MDTFIEKIVSRKKGAREGLIASGIVIGAIAVFFIFQMLTAMFGINLGSIGLFLGVGIIYLAYRLIIGLNVEFEYVVTNGDVDIDKIIARRNRKRIFSGSCKDFDIVARVSSSGFEEAARNAKVKIDATSMPGSDGAYYVTLNYKGERTIVIFEPDERMLANFRTFIPRKVLTN